MLFEQERFNISIHNVVKYSPKSSSKHSYPGKLPTYELMYFEKGDVTLTFNNQYFHITEGNMIYLPKGLENDDYTIYVNEEFSLYNIYFFSDTPLPKTPIKFNAKAQEYKNIYEKIYRIWISKRVGYYFSAMQYVYNIFELIYRQQTEYQPMTKYNCLLPCEDYISAHYCDESFDYKKLAELSGLSYSYFKKLFIAKHLSSPVKYVTLLKINRACELMESKKFSISEVASLCGYKNIYYFSNVFKKLKGSSPTQYLMGDKDI